MQVGSSRGVGTLAGVLAALAVGLVVGIGGACSSTPPEERREVAKAAARDAMQDLRALLQQKVVDKEKRVVALAAVDAMEVRLDAARREIGAALVALQQTNARFDATRPELDRVMTSFVETRRATRSAVIAAHIRLRDATPEAVWPDVYDLEEKAVLSKLGITPKEPGRAGGPGGEK